MADVMVVAIVAVVISVLVVAGRGRAPTRDVSVTVNTASDSGRLLPAGFLGQSLEYSAIESYAGRDPSAIDPVFETLIRNLNPGQAPVLRIGGTSTDGSWWPVAGMARPAGVTFNLDQRWLEVTRALATELSARLILGINLEAGSVALAATEARALVNGIRAQSVQALELGNEPDLYGQFAWSRTADGRSVPGRARSYDVGAFTSDFTAVASGLPQVPLAGPAFGSLAWTSHLAGFLSAQPRVRLVTLHRYPLQSCFARSGWYRYPTINHLLSTAASAGLARSLAPYASVSHAHGEPLRIDELNTVACGAVPKISNSFASALWALDTMFEMVHAGIDGVNIHTFPGAGYELFRISHVDGRWRASVPPEYYGLLMFVHATPAGSRLLPVSPTASDQTKIWATRARDGQIRVVLINKDIANAHAVSVRGLGTGAAGALERLQAPSITATSGVTLGGRSFGATTYTGALQGSIGTLTLRPSRGTYVVALPPGSAALLTVPPRAG